MDYTIVLGGSKDLSSVVLLIGHLIEVSTIFSR